MSKTNEHEAGNWPTLDFTNLEEANAVLFAYHQAGHAVVAFHLTGDGGEGASIEPGAGCAKSGATFGGVGAKPDRSHVEAEIQFLWAGAVVEAMLVGVPPIRPRGALNKKVLSLAKLVTTDPPGLLNRLWEATKTFIAQPHVRQQIGWVAGALFERKTLSAADIREFMRARLH